MWKSMLLQVGNSKILVISKIQKPLFCLEKKNMYVSGFWKIIQSNKWLFYKISFLYRDFVRTCFHLCLILLSNIFTFICLNLLAKFKNLYFLILLKTWFQIFQMSFFIVTCIGGLRKSENKKCICVRLFVKNIFVEILHI